MNDAKSANGKELTFGEFWKAITDAHGALDNISIDLPNGKTMEIDITGVIDISE